jgi:NADH-quinone oxidoreductase subunit M
MLWLYQRTMFGKIDNPANAAMKDLNGRELATLLPLVALAIWIGIYPSPILRRLESSVARVTLRVNAVYGPALAKLNDCLKDPVKAPVVVEGGIPGFATAPPCEEPAKPVKPGGGVP